MYPSTFAHLEKTEFAPATTAPACRVRVRLAAGLRRRFGVVSRSPRYRTSSAGC
jgi:hypothetical protein